jgi:hypothetical protein
MTGYSMIGGDYDYYIVKYDPGCSSQVAGNTPSE